MVVLVLGVLLVASSLLLLAAATAPPPLVGVDRSVAMLGTVATSQAGARPAAPASTTFTRRVLEPLLGRVRARAGRLTSRSAEARLRRRLDRAGNPRGWDVDRVVTLRVLGAVVLGLLAGAVLVVLTPGPLGAVLLLVAAVALGWAAPELYLYQRAYDRAEALGRALPDAIDLLRLGVEAGLGFDAALQQVAQRTRGPIAEELSRVLREMRLGSSRSEALTALASRTQVDGVHALVSALTQADTFGVPVADVLRVQSHELRVKRRQRAEHRAQQVPVKITVPLVLCILPCLVVAVMGPAVIRIMSSLG